MDRVPKYHELMNPMFQAIRQLGGSATIEEIYDKVMEENDFPDEDIGIVRIHSRE